MSVVMRAAVAPLARRDLAEAPHWIGRDSPLQADRLRVVLRGLTIALADYPLIGTELPELAPPPYRFIPVRGFPYLVVYDASRSPPLIVRVVHGARDLPEALADLRRFTPDLPGAKPLP